MRVRDDVLNVPKVGRVTLSRRGGNPHAGYPPVKTTVKRVNGKWYCVVVYKVPAVARPDNGLALGVDMNCGQVAASTGDVLRMPDMARLDGEERWRWPLRGTVNMYTHGGRHEPSTKVYKSHPNSVRSPP